MSIERQGEHIFLFVFLKNKVYALADFVAGNTGFGRWLHGQKSCGLILVTRTNNINITIFRELEIKHELMPGSDRNQRRNLRLWFAFRLEREPVSTNLNGSSRHTCCVD